MPLKNYGVWVGYPISFVAETDDNTPHLQLYFDEDPSATKGGSRAAINIKSSSKESRLVYWFVRNFDHNPITDSLAILDPGWHLRSDRVPALDYIRGNLFNIRDGSILAHNLPGEKNDIIDYITPILTQAIQRKATIYIFGEQFTRGEPGIHDVHMNQGNTGRFAKYNGAWQDGGILLHFPHDDHWEGIFLAFGVQKVHTDDDGNPISGDDFVKTLETRGTRPSTPVPEHDEPDTQPPVTNIEGSIFVRAALLNPIGPDQTTTSQPETVYLINKSARQVNLTGSSIMNRSRAKQALSGVLASQSSKGFAVPDAPLSNNGGTISLLDRNGLKVDGVSYSKAQAEREGELVYFN